MGIPSLVLLILAMLVIPLPPILLDILFTFNILIGLLVIMIAIGTKKPLDFSSFPAVLLLATMLRLSLNVASTRVVLVNGHTGSGAAGQVIESFGEFVVGGNYVVGAIVFGILILINFLVITTIFSLNQAVIAANAGVTHVLPFCEPFLDVYKYSTELILEIGLTF